MNIQKCFLSLTALVASSLAVAQTSSFSQTSVSASSGSVSGRSSGGGGYVGMAGTAGRATIDFTFDTGDGGVGPASIIGGGHEDKFAPGPAGRVFDGVVGETPDASVVTSGQSSVTSAGPGAPTYYDAQWQSTTTRSSSVAGSTDSGTYDPWNVTYGDVMGLGVPPGGNADLYYQASLNAGTGFSLGTTGSGSYAFLLYISSGAGVTPILDLEVSSDGSRTVSFGTDPQLELYLLGSNASDPFASPDARIGQGLLLTPTNSNALDAYFGLDGTVLHDLNFGVRYHDFALPTSGADDDVLFSWHTDTFAQTRIASVPGPAPVFAFALGALDRLRRRPIRK